MSTSKKTLTLVALVVALAIAYKVVLE